MFSLTFRRLVNRLPSGMSSEDPTLSAPHLLLCGPSGLRCGTLCFLDWEAVFERSPSTDSSNFLSPSAIPRHRRPFVYSQCVFSATSGKVICHPSRHSSARTFRDRAAPFNHTTPLLQIFVLPITTVSTRLSKAFPTFCKSPFSPPKYRSSHPCFFCGRDEFFSYGSLSVLHCNDFFWPDPHYTPQPLSLGGPPPPLGSARGSILLTLFLIRDPFALLTFPTWVSPHAVASCSALGLFPRFILRFWSVMPLVSSPSKIPGTLLPPPPRVRGSASPPQGGLSFLNLE